MCDFATLDENVGGSFRLVTSIGEKMDDFDIATYSVCTSNIE